MRSHLVPIYACGLTLLAATSADAQPKRGEIIHDAEHYILEAQLGEGLPAHLDELGAALGRGQAGLLGHPAP